MAIVDSSIYRLITLFALAKEYEKFRVLRDIVFRNSCMKQSIFGISYIIFYDIKFALTIISIGIHFNRHLESTIKGFIITIFRR